MFSFGTLALYPSVYKMERPGVPDPDMSQGEAAYARLLKEIRAGAFQPGDRLREVEVADRLALSRTPVREALRRLEADGIVEHRPRLGAVIRQLRHAELVELYELRTVLERTAAEPDMAAALNQDFHRGIYHATRNRFLLEAARSLNNALLLLRPTTLDDPERIGVVAGQHEEMLHAMAIGDATAAGEAAEVHLQTSLRHRLKVLRA
mgnify:CR=1 FL=1